MSRNYSVKTLFRETPNKQLSRFFSKYNVLEHLDFTIIGEHKIDEIFNAWLALPDEVRSNLDSTLQQIFELSCEKGFHAIRDEVAFQLQDNSQEFKQFIDIFSKLSNHYERAMVAFLDYPTCWEGATYFYHADTLGHWCKRQHMGHIPAALDSQSLNELSNEIRDYYHNTQGRGNHCTVEVFKRGNLDYFFAYPEDYSQNGSEWVGGHFKRRPHNPALEIVFIYSRKEGTLDIHTQGPNKDIEALQKIFAQAILKITDLPPDPKDNRIYNLNSLASRGFNFNTSEDYSIIDVSVSKIRFSSRVRQGSRIIFEGNIEHGISSVYEQIEDSWKSLNLGLYNVTKVEIVATIDVHHIKKPKTFRFSLTHPNRCTLKYDPVGLKLRKMLTASGIELQELETAAIDEPVDA